MEGPIRAASLASTVVGAGWTRPYLLTEASARGALSPEVVTLSWGSHAEADSTTKAADIGTMYASLLQSAAPAAVPGGGGANGGALAGLFFINYGERAGPQEARFPVFV